MLKKYQKLIGYIIYPKTFCDSNNDGIGDIQGIISKLDYLYELGVNLIWICPLFDSLMDDNGYDVRDYYKINHLFGNMDDFDLLIQEAHKRDIKILIDFVLNHTSVEHKWFQDVLKNPSSNKKNYYLFKKPLYDKNNNPLLINNWKGFFSTSVWEYSPKIKESYMHIFSKQMPDVNWANKDLRDEYVDIMNFYLNKGVDGFRLDAVAHLAKDLSFNDSSMVEDKNGLAFDVSKFSNRPETVTYLSYLKKHSYGKYDVITIGEVGGGITPKNSLKYINKNNGPLDMIFNFDTSWCNHAYGSIGVSDNQIKTEVNELRNGFYRWYHLLHKDAKGFPIYYDNHDHPRALSQYGSIKYRKESAKMLMTTLLFMYGIPFIYYNDEIGMSNVNYQEIEDFNDVEVKNYIEENKTKFSKKEMIHFFNRVSRINARTPMQWNDSVNAGFSKVNPCQKVNDNYKDVNVNTELNDKDSILNYAKKAINIRKNNYADLVDEPIHFFNAHNNDVLGYYHKNNKERIIVVSNFRDTKINYTLPFLPKRIILSNYGRKSITNKSIVLEPFETILFE